MKNVQTGDLWWFHKAPVHVTPSSSPSHAIPPSGFSGSSSFTRFTRLVTLAASLTSPQVLRIHPCGAGNPEREPARKDTTMVQFRLL